MTRRWQADEKPAPIHGGLADLRARFTIVEDAAGILAFCVDATDPSFSIGSAVLCSGDDEYYCQTSPVFDAARMSALAAIMGDAMEALPKVCVVKSSRTARARFSLRSHSAQAVPETFLPEAVLAEHPGFLAVNADFAMLVAPCGDDRSNPQFVLLLTDTGTGERHRIYSASVHWLPWVEAAASKAAHAVTVAPDPADTPDEPSTFRP